MCMHETHFNGKNQICFDYIQRFLNGSGILSIIVAWRMKIVSKNDLTFSWFLGNLRFWVTAKYRFVFFYIYQVYGSGAHFFLKKMCFDFKLVFLFFFQLRLGKSTRNTIWQNEGRFFFFDLFHSYWLLKYQIHMLPEESTSDINFSFFRRAEKKNQCLEFDAKSPPERK